MSFNLKHTFLNASVNLQIALTTEARLVEGQRLDEQQNVEKLRMFRAGT
jgi:hypothetical protein